MNPVKASVLGLLSMGTGSPTPQAPSIEYSSLLDCIQITQTSSSDSPALFRLGGSGVQAAFLPGPKTWSPADLELSEGHTMTASLQWNHQEVAKFAFYVKNIDGVFSRASVRGTTTEMEEAGFVTEHPLQKPGEYLLSVRIDQKECASVPFRLKLEPSGDPFEAKSTVSVEGPWSQWGYFASRPDKENAPVEFRTWLKQNAPGTQDDFELQILRSGEPYAKGGKLRIGESQFRPHAFRLQYVDKNRGTFGMQSLNDTDGELEIIILCNGDPWGRYTCTAKDGALLAHARSDASLVGAPEYLLPRLWSQTPSQRRITTWCERSQPKK